MSTEQTHSIQTNNNTHLSKRASTSQSYNSSNYTDSSREHVTPLYERKFSTNNNVRKPIPTNGKIPKTQKSSLLTDMQKRIFSARQLRVNTFQNQLIEAQRTISTLTNENRMLRTLHQRQEVALSKYESANADLPKLLNSHAEEVRVWDIKYRNLSNAHKELTERLQKKEVLLQALADQNKYFNQLNKSKNLEQRQKLTEQLEEVQKQIEEKDKDMKQSVWRLEAEIRYVKQLLVKEQNKGNDYVGKLEKSRVQLGNIKKVIDDVKPNEKKSIEKKQVGFIKKKPEHSTELSTATDTDTPSYTVLPKVQKSTQQMKKVVRASSTAKHVHFQRRVIPSRVDGGGLPKHRVEHGAGDAPIIVGTKSNLSRLSDQMNICEKDVQERPSESTISEDLYSIKSSDEGEPTKTDDSVNSPQNGFIEEGNIESARSFEAPTTDEEYEQVSVDSLRDCNNLNEDQEISTLNNELSEDMEDEWSKSFTELSEQDNELSLQIDKNLKIQEIDSKPLKNDTPKTKVNKLLASLKDEK